MLMVANPDVHPSPSCSLVCQHLYWDSLELPLDPALVSGSDRTRSINALTALSRVNRLFHAEARPYLYANISVALPASFETLVGTIGVLEPIKPISDLEDDRQGRKPSVVIPTYEERDGLLSPPASRETSRERGECDGSTAEGTMFNAAPDTACGPSSDFFMPISPSSAASQSISPQFAGVWREDNPGLLARSITFERFRSHGLRRTVREGSRQRFVTPSRLLQILRGTRTEGSLFPEDGRDVDGENLAVSGHSAGKLQAVGLTEYIDVCPFVSSIFNALTVPAVGAHTTCTRGNSAPGRHRLQRHAQPNVRVGKQRRGQSAARHST